MVINGKTINLRTVDVSDADFIFNLRSSEVKSKYLTPISGNLQDQIKWILAYKEREIAEKEFYFVIETKEKKNLGLVRMYDFIDSAEQQGSALSFSWGSWIILSEAPKTTAIESAMQIYNFGFNERKFQKSHFSVRKENINVVNFHLRFGAQIIKESSIDLFFIFTRDNYISLLPKYSRFIK